MENPIHRIKKWWNSNCQMNLARNKQDLHKENYNTFWNNLKEGSRKWENVHFWIGWPTFINMSIISPNALNAFTVKIPKVCFRFVKLILGFTNREMFKSAKKNFWNIIIQSLRNIY